eukprot:CAMPEP_0170296788 /NCGR_PEP_ID=MMETSP0116_2-20130129/48546_1 /TAXON_ID=400756 /ORGANISM="Durinskia baltica, Strain CSIRO CS-38" /LENGTH=108 /DNA_ID=CAMNT_0010548395 /DNA_START=42 /DNA_END=368 /DNA_ORIENTATION=-
MMPECAAPMSAAGADRMAALPAIATRVNFLYFQQSEVGATVRIGGRLGSDCRLTTTDGGVLTVLADAESLPAAGFPPDSFVEVDVELWDDAVKMTHMPQLRELFAPMA